MDSADREHFFLHESTKENQPQKKKEKKKENL
jgi:hypothetical protein